MKDKNKDRNKSNLTLSDVLTYGLLHFNTLLLELPTLLNALDTNKSVILDGIEDKSLREYLDRLFTYLPVKYVIGEGYCARDKDFKVTKYIINELLKVKAIKQPIDLSTNQSHMSRFTISKLFDLLDKYPNIIPDLKQLLTMLQDNNEIDLNDMDDQDVADELNIFLSSIGLNENDGIFSSNNKSNEVLNYLLKAITSSDKYLDHYGIISNKSNNKSSDVSSDSSSDSDSEESIKSSNYTSNNKDLSNTTIIGPSIPNQSQFDLAQRLARSQNYIDEDSEYGPILPINKQDDDLPIGLLGTNLNRDDEIDLKEIKTDKQNLREEWMLTPGERDPYKGIKDGTNRKFQSSKQAKKLADQYLQNKPVIEPSAEDLLTQQIIEEHNKKRGPSLMETHLNKFDNKKSKYTNERVPFDREQDILTHRKLNSSEVEKLVENSKLLDTKFNKSSVQKSFM